VAFVVHGVLDSAETMRPFARALVDYGGFDAVYGYDSWAYWGAANRGWQLKTIDLLYIVQPAVRGMVLGLPRTLARRAAILLQTGSYVVEGAAQDVAALAELLPFEEVCLIGHCLGGLVVRCAVEEHLRARAVRSVVTLGSPHELYLEYRPPEQWDPRPDPKVRYLSIVGERDWVASDPAFADFSPDDEGFDNVYKVLYPGEGRLSIHEEADETYVPELIEAFVGGSFGHRRDVWVTEGVGTEPSLHLATVSGPPPRVARATKGFSGRWLQFRTEQP
jgi:pimeloyl-ACP methyl ester carboxylesterase